MIVAPLPDETHIIKRLNKGDETAFSTLHRHYSEYIKHKVLRILHSPELAEDVTQEIFIKIWEARHQIIDIRSFQAYLLTTARNHAINVLKSAARRADGMGEILSHFSPISTITEDAVQDNEYSRFIRRKVEELPPRTKEIFNLCREQSRSYHEVAALLGITRDAVKSRMMHAMKLLRQASKNEMDLPLFIFVVLILIRQLPLTPILLSS
jgi:RNA polymerase sigma-70 factor (family 1)